MYGLVPSSPQELGFSEKFSSWRNNQPEAIEKSITSTKRVVANCAQTGFGKSGCYVAQAVLEGGRSVFLTGTKGLQDQLLEDHGSQGLVTIKGKENYTCQYRPGWSCKDGYAGDCPHKGSPECGWGNAYNIARVAPMVSTNYKFWINIHRYGMGLGKFDRLVLDEAHNCPDEVAESMQVKISFHEVQEMLERDFPTGQEPDGEAWKDWARKMIVVCKDACLKKLAQIQHHKSPKPTWMKEYHHLKNIIQKLGILALMRPKDWVWEMSDWGWQFDPVRFDRYAESRLLLGVPKVIMYSATLRPKTANMLGIKMDDMDFTDWPSIFDPKRSPIYQIPTMRVDSRANGDYSLLGMRCDQFMGPRLDLGRNGTVHVTSFKYRDAIYYNSRYKARMISHFDDSPSSKAVQMFKDKGGVLISPSIAEGYDFIDDLCRFQVLTKIPFLPKSKIIDARQAADNLYVPYIATQRLGQMAGRGTRSEKDWCENAIMDDHFADWFGRKYSSLISKAFWQRYVRITSVPKPMEV